MKILAVSCHPDDIEIAAGGTLLKYAARGDEVTICHLANGDKGDVVTPSSELRVIRNAEAQKGGARLGAKKVVSIDIPDLMVDSRDEATLMKLIRVIRDADPDVIITHSPDDYMKDHVEVSNLVFDASISATIPHIGEGKYMEHIPPIYYMDTLMGVGFQPEVYVDITEHMEGKIEALECHVSLTQWMREHDHVVFTDMVRTWSKYRGYQCGAGYAEGFISCKRYLRQHTRALLPLD